MEIWTDGSCIGNPGPGGWAFIVADSFLSSSGRKAPTTNNEMELEAFLQAIDFAISCRAEIVQIFTDSLYVVNGFNSLKIWEARGWKTTRNLPIKHCPTWRKILKYLDEIILEVTHVSAHSGEPYNEMADKLAREQAESFY